MLQKHVHNSALFALAMIGALLLFAACSKVEMEPVTEGNSQLTQGTVQTTLEIGKTTKADVLENFGSPNVTTRDGNGREVWSYQRSSQSGQSETAGYGWTILFAGSSNDSSGYQTSSRMITLIIKFDEDDVVSDYNSRTSNF